jgi:hypothetical protein
MFQPNYKPIPNTVGGANTFINARNSFEMVNTNVTDNILFPTTTSEINIINYTYTYDDIKKSIIIRNPSSDSYDNMELFRPRYQVVENSRGELSYVNAKIQKVSSDTLFLYYFDIIKLTNGSGYVDGYNVPSTGGSGSGMTFSIRESSGNLNLVEIEDPGSGYLSGDVLTIGGSGTGGTVELRYSSGSSFVVVAPGKTYMVRNENEPSLGFSNI